MSGAERIVKPEAEQGTPEWRAQRAGKVTASVVFDMIARDKNGKFKAARENLLVELIVERLTGVPSQHYISKAMQWGVDQEPNARKAYEFFANVDVERAFFVPHPTIEMAGASPDGKLVGRRGLVELKNPNTKTHLEWMMANVVPEEHEPQMMFQMACCPEAEYCDFFSFDTRLPIHMRGFLKMLPRDEKRIREIEDETVKFLRELDTRLAELTCRFKRKKAGTAA